MIRPATRADVDSIRELVLTAYARYVPRIGRRPQPMDDDYRALIDAGRVWVADGEAPGRVAGVLVMITQDDHLLVHNVAVAERVRGTGLGAALLTFAEHHARGLGLPEVRLFTNVKMTKNLAYYPRRGYRRTGERIVDGLTRVYFAKPVDLPGVHDSGVRDSGVHDSGAQDSGVHDSGAQDSGVRDSGAQDSGGSA